jgi:hypothetical protein
VLYASRDDKKNWQNEAKMPSDFNARRDWELPKNEVTSPFAAGIATSWRRGLLLLRE